MTRHRFDNLERRLLRAVRGDDYTRREGECRLAPEWLILCINNFCNLHCRMCDVGLGASDTVYVVEIRFSIPQARSPASLSLGAGFSMPFKRETHSSARCRRFGGE